MKMITRRQATRCFPAYFSERIGDGAAPRAAAGVRNCLLLCALLFSGWPVSASPGGHSQLAADFEHPPESARPWVYWYFMDGNLNRQGMTADLKAMKRAGIGGAIFLEVNLGMPRGPVNFMSAQWLGLVKNAANQADRLGLQIALGAGPGWCGAGGPWVPVEHSMQDLVASETNVTGPGQFDAVLPTPPPRPPYFGMGTLTPKLRAEWAEFYRDVCVLAFPTPGDHARIADVDEKALYVRAPYSSLPGVKPRLPAPAHFPSTPAADCISSNQIVNLTGKLSPDGRLEWNVPPGQWTILRFGRRSTGQITRPAPLPGLGFECDKFDPAAMHAQLDAFVGKILKTIGPQKRSGGGVTDLHFDSWEMNSQNWTKNFREAFEKRRGYDPLCFLPVLTGRIVGNREMSERFLWDLRRTAQELVVENCAQQLRKFAHHHGLTLSIEPYDMNPAGDLALGSAADVPMGEFWAQGYGFHTKYSIVEAVSLGHTLDRRIIGAESFTANPGEDWRLYPGALKAQADWALGAGINRLVIHRYAAQPWLDRRPGMTMWQYGVHWERTQTWWSMVPAFHRYLARCQMMLRRGLPVADILYLDAQGAPDVFRPPPSALRPGLPDRRGYNFDGCGTDTLIARASVKNGRIVFPGGMSYRVLVLPELQTMTPRLLRKIRQLVRAGATVIGAPPQKSPSLQDYPQCDAEVKKLAAQIWGPGPLRAERSCGKGRVILDTNATVTGANPLAPLSSAKWIWYPEGHPAVSAPIATCFFRKSFSIAPGRSIASARVIVTADNSFQLCLNGQAVANGDNFNEFHFANVARVLKPGSNRLSVMAENVGNAPNPAGLIAALKIRFRDGSTRLLVTDGSWTAALTTNGAGRPALELGRWDMQPWHETRDAVAFATIYPGYTMTAAALRRLGVPPDFESAGDVRYTHRHERDGDVYFVANRIDKKLSARCTFRVSGMQPELWNPVTGRRRALPEFRQINGRTTIPLRFAPYQSYFIVFRKGPAAVPRGRNFATLRPVKTLSGPWQVSFDPKWGGPKRVTFEKLEDWTQRPEPGIRFYSGQATYRRTFTIGSDRETEDSRWYLDLGRVKVMARVKLNGRDLGVVWCAPWRVAIPRGLLRQGGNDLEVTVANLWCNRLIRDSGLPPDRRLTWTTSNPFKPDSPLLPSGLLGPVKLEVAEQ